MAPERFDTEYGADVTSAADVFAWGAVVTYAATGHTPFAADSPTATAMRILTQPPDTSGVPEPLLSIVESALVKHAERRPSARELLDALLGGQTQPMRMMPAAVPPPDDTVDVPRRPRRKGWLAVVAAVLLLLAVGAVGVHQFNAQAEDTPAAQEKPAEPVDPLTAVRSSRTAEKLAIDRDAPFDYPLMRGVRSTSTSRPAMVTTTRGWSPAAAR